MKPSPELIAMARLQCEPTLLVGGEGQIGFANRPACELLGATDLAGTSLMQWSDDPAQVRRMLRRCATSGQPVVGRLDLVAEGGETQVFPFRGVVLIRDQGRATLFALQRETGARFRSLTASYAQAHIELKRQRRRERQARLEEARLRTIWNSIGDGAIATDAQGCVTRMNPVAEELTGWGLADAMGRPLPQVFDIVNAFSGEPVVNPVQQVLLTGKTVDLANHTVLIARGGTRRHIADSGAPIKDDRGTITGVVLVFHDVTDKYESRARLLRLTAAIEQAADSIVLTDANGLIEYVNPAFEKVTGYTREQVIGKTNGIVQSGQHNRDFYDGMWSTLRRGEVWTGRCVNKRADGTLYTEDASISPVRSPTGEVSGYVSVRQDVTDRLLLERELQQAQRMEAVGLLAGGVAHDFNNLLTVIHGCCDFMGQSVAPTDPLYRDLSDIMGAANRASDLTKQLLAFSRRQVMHPEVLDLNRLVSDLMKMLRRLVPADIALAESLAGDLQNIEVDPGQVEQVIVNLVVNARDAMPSGGTITLTTALEEVTTERAQRHATLQPGTYVSLRICDTGTGMSEEAQARAFDPFFTTKPTGQGTGLGLSTVLGIIDQSGGSILFDTTPGEGTCFTLFFPATGGEVSQVRPVPTPAVVVGTEVILVVEDEDGVRSLAVRALEQSGYRVLQARSGTEALSMSTLASELDLLLCDVVMPGHSGFDVAEAYSSLNPRLKVLFMSGYPGEQLAERGVLPQGAELLQKPFAIRELTQRVRGVLDSD